MTAVLPDKRGDFEPYGGKFVPETSMSAFEELENVYLKIKRDKLFQQELNYYLREYAGISSPLYFAQRLSREMIGT